MTRGLLSVPAMRPNHCWTVLRVSILAVLLVTLNADSEDSNCELQIKVHRHTLYEGFPGKDLRINCTVVFCSSSPPEVSWYKLEKTAPPSPLNVSSNSRIKTEWKSLKDLGGTSYLIFQNALISDSGVYLCRSGGSVSHYINVTVNDSVVSDEERINDTQKNETEVTQPDPPSPAEDLLMYVYAGAGIVAFVILVIIISVASMQGCKGKPKTETRTDNQYMAIPMVEQPFQQSPRGSPSVPLPRRSTRKKAPSSQPNELPLPRDDEHLYGQIQEDRERQRNVQEEEGGSVVYAALNHQLPARAAARPRRQMDETSEYAAIRI
ncbi:hypothetical protein L3Q82_009835 [Scortum barcoo]|uniref:Uncharacterized protein n=1 Tax=Scortum barcoo TaxID=214431 RepID=A0ACB8WH36_9TELE|nr:hypothetical protein L3Q82_009835 [Scortum barcoo]